MNKVKQIEEYLKSFKDELIHPYNRTRTQINHENFLTQKNGNLILVGEPIVYHAIWQDGKKIIIPKNLTGRIRTKKEAKKNEKGVVVKKYYAQNCVFLHFRHNTNKENEYQIKIIDKPFHKCELFLSPKAHEKIFQITIKNNSSSFSKYDPHYPLINEIFEIKKHINIKKDIFNTLDNTLSKFYLTNKKLTIKNKYHSIEGGIGIFNLKDIYCDEIANHKDFKPYRHLVKSAP